MAGFNVAKLRPEILCHQSSMALVGRHLTAKETGVIKLRWRYHSLRSALLQQLVRSLLITGPSDPSLHEHPSGGMVDRAAGSIARPEILEEAETGLQA